MFGGGTAGGGAGGFGIGEWLKSLFMSGSAGGGSTGGLGSATSSPGFAGGIFDFGGGGGSPREVPPFSLGGPAAISNPGTSQVSAEVPQVLSTPRELTREEKLDIFSQYMQALGQGLDEESDRRAHDFSQIVPLGGGGGGGTLPNPQNFGLSILR